MNRTSAFRIGCVVLLAALCAGSAVLRGAQENISANSVPALLWRDPGDLAARDLFYGPGGRENAPHGKFRFIEEIAEGASPKFDVVDEQGTRWRVKLGEEVRSETAATRLLWAAGYFADENYYVTDLRVEGLPDLRRGGEHVTPNGAIRAARLERRPKDRKQVSNWSWFENPFVGTRELSGLKIMMALMNHWDLKDANNAIYEENGERRYVVSDVGASFGRTGHHFNRTKDNLEHYAESKFIHEVSPHSVDFHLKSRPLPFEAILFPRYRKQAQREKVVKEIPREHARWMGQLLSRLSDEQIRDCFRAAGYSPDEVEGFAHVVQRRISALQKL